MDWATALRRISKPSRSFRTSASISATGMTELATCACQLAMTLPYSFSKESIRPVAMLLSMAALAWTFCPAELAPDRMWEDRARRMVSMRLAGGV